VTQGGRQGGSTRTPIPFELDRRALAFRFRRRLKSTTRGIDRTVRDIIREARECKCLPDDVPGVEIALREALANAVLHGNRNVEDKRVLVRAYCDPDQGVLIVVRDEGAGFDPEGVPDPRRKDRRELSHGRGIFLMRELMDHVEHRKGGREVVLVKRFR
jgi:serine/threonine-protein kinase RsbW